MKTKQFVALLKRNGCILLRSGGKHDIWCNPKTKQKYAIPRHQSKELSRHIEAEAREVLGIE